jgi:hypothetical protein
MASLFNNMFNSKKQNKPISKEQEREDSESDSDEEQEQQQQDQKQYSPRSRSRNRSHSPPKEKHNNSDEEDDDEEEEDEDDKPYEPLKKYIKNNTIVPISKNKYFCMLSMGSHHTITNWDLQRSISQEKVQQIVKDLEEHYNKYGEYEFTDPIHIGHKINEENIHDKEKFTPHYIIDGQHRLEAYKILYNTKNYKIDYFPCYVHEVTSEEEFLTIFDKVNNRLVFDRTKLLQFKLFELEKLLDKHFKKIWGSNRPYVDKKKLFEKLRLRDYCQKSEAKEIFDKLLIINKKIKCLPRSKRCKTTSTCHEKAENIDLFLGLDKDMKWIDEI